MKEKWYQYIIDNKKHWCNGLTTNRLNKIKEAVLSDKHIMWDLLMRHNANIETPEQMVQSNKENFNHCIGNFVLNIRYKMIDVGMITNK